MSNLDDLLKLRGVVAAGEFSPDGTLLDWRIGLHADGANENLLRVGRLNAQFVATVTMLFNSMADTYERLSDLRWSPQKGWLYVGGDWLVAVGGGRAVYAQTSEADIAELYESVIGGSS